MEQAKCPSTDKQIKKMRCDVCVRVCVLEYYSAIKRQGVLPFVITDETETGGHEANGNKLEKDEYCMVLLMCGI